MTQPVPRQPYPLAADYLSGNGADHVPSLQELGEKLDALAIKVDALVPAVAELQKRAAWWAKAVSVVKYALPAVALQMFPAIAKYVPIIVDALGKASGP